MQYNLEEYNLIEDHDKKSRIFRVIILILVIGIIYTLSNFKFNIYEKYLLYFDGNEYYVLLELDKQDNFKNEDKLIINGSNYKYEINEENSNYTTFNNIIYKSVNIKIREYTNREMYSYVQVLHKSSTLVNMIFDFINGGNNE